MQKIQQISISQNTIYQSNDYLLYFQNQLIRQRLSSQILQIQPKYIKLISLLYSKIVIYLAIPIKNNHIQDSISYIITIGKQYPLRGVRVYLIQNIIKPQLNDLRDLTTDILGKKWTYRNRVNQICLNLKGFTERLLELTKKQECLKLQKIGSYYIGQQFSYELICDTTQLQKFMLNQNGNIQKLFCVTQTNIVILDPCQNKQNQQKRYQLSYAGNIQCIEEITYCIFAKQFMIKLRDYKQQKEMRIKLICDVQKFNNAICKIFKVISRYQKISIQHIQKNKSVQILKQVQENEQKYKKKLNKKYRNKLIESYKKIIEYYFQKGQNFAYLVYIHKLQQIFNQSNK